MTTSDFALFKNEIRTEQKITMFIQDSENIGGAIHERIEFISKDDFERVYWQLLCFCVDNNGIVVSTSVKNNAVTVLLEVDE